jgi:transposase
MPGKPSLGRPTCRGTTKAGKPCQAKAAAGSAYCGQHGGAKRKTGRPSKLNDETLAAIVDAVSDGLTLNVAAQAAGINVATLHSWRDRGDADLEAGRTSIFARLVDELTRATAAGEVTLVRRIRSHGSGPAGDWRALAWLLERRFPERYGKRLEVDATLSERAEPRVVSPDEDKRDRVLAMLNTALAPPAGADE